MFRKLSFQPGSFACCAVFILIVALQSQLQDIVYVQLYLRDMTNFAAINAVKTKSSRLVQCFPTFQYAALSRAIQSACFSFSSLHTGSMPLSPPFVSELEQAIMADDSLISMDCLLRNRLADSASDARLEIMLLCVCERARVRVCMRV